MTHLLRIAQTHHRRLIRLFQATEIGLVLLVIFLFLQGQSQLPRAFPVLEFGRRLGIAAEVFLALSLAPGIAKRLNFALGITRLLMPFRRHLGILMYLFALGHVALNYLLGAVIMGSFPPRVFPRYILAGFLTLLLLFPLFLTANDPAVRLLKKSWRRLHKLVYLSLVPLFLHLYLQGSWHALILGGILFLELLSYRFRVKNMLE